MSVRIKINLIIFWNDFGASIPAARNNHCADLNHYQFSDYAGKREPCEGSIEFNADGESAQAQRGDQCCPAAHERVEDEVAFIGGGAEDAVEKREGLLGGMLAEFFLPRFRGRDGPNGFHLLAGVGVLHEL